MGGSGGGGAFSRISPADLQRQVRQSEFETADAEFAPKLAELMDTFLAGTRRDIEGTQLRLGKIKNALKDQIEKTFDLYFGGSVAKHTYVDGLSDTDSLLVMRAPLTETNVPSKILEDVATQLKDELQDATEISKGRIAVTIRYRDGNEIQIIPAVRFDKKLHVPAWRRDGWSRIDPEAFTKVLTKRNEQCNGKLVPTIKLAKAINATLPEGRQLTGYHIESLAVSAFRDYDGARITSKMLPRFFEQIPSLLLAPIRDRTGQSVHVDAYLGAKGSDARREASHLFNRLSKRINNATAAGSVEQWRAILSGD